MCIALGYGLYKKTQSKKTAPGNPDEKDQAPRPHPVNVGPAANYGPPPNNGPPPMATYNANQRV